MYTVQPRRKCVYGQEPRTWARASRHATQARHDFCCTKMCLGYVRFELGNFTLFTTGIERFLWNSRVTNRPLVHDQWNWYLLYIWQKIGFVFLLLKPMSKQPSCSFGKKNVCRTTKDVSAHAIWSMQSRHIYLVLGESWAIRSGTHRHGAPARLQQAGTHKYIARGCVYGQDGRGHYTFAPQARARSENRFFSAKVLF